MINRELTNEVKQARCFHDNFIVMLTACVLWPNKWDAGETIGTWFSFAFPNSELTEEEFNDTLIQRIREKLLFIGFGRNVPLFENMQTKRIQKEIVFD